MVGVGLVAQHGGRAGEHILRNQVFPDNGDHHTGGAYILLRAAVEHAVLGYVHRLTEEAAGNIRHQILALGVGQGVEFGAINCVVLADIDIIRVLADGQVRAVGNIGKGLVGGGRHGVGLTVHLSLLISLLGPLTGDDIVGNLILHQVHGNHGELLGSAALQKQNLIVVGNAHQGTKVGFRFIDDGLVGLGAVAHFHDGHTGSPVVQHFIGGFF